MSWHCCVRGSNKRNSLKEIEGAGYSSAFVSNGSLGFHDPLNLKRDGTVRFSTRVAVSVRSDARSRRKQKAERARAACPTGVEGGCKNLLEGCCLVCMCFLGLGHKIAQQSIAMR